MKQNYFCGLDLYRSVSNIDSQDAAYLERDLLRRNPEEEDQKRIQRLFSRGVRLPLRSVIMSRVEIMELQKRVGVAPDRPNVRELAEYISGVLPDFSGHPIENVPTLPAKTYHNRGRTTLTVGTSMEAIQERALCKQLIADFYGAGEMRGVWNNDQFMTEVRLVFADNKFGETKIEQLRETLNSGSVRRLPETLTLQPLEQHISG